MALNADVAIIGAGIVGLAIGREIVSRFPNSSVVILEKESSLACHQTGHNSGVIHSGIYYLPGSLKATLCRAGATSMIRYCEEHSIPVDVCGKVVVATDQSELPRLEILFQRGQANGLPGLQMLSAEEIREREPHSSGIRGIHVPGTAIVDYRVVAQRYAQEIEGRGGKILLSSQVTNLRTTVRSTTIETTGEAVEAKLVINCAGLQSDRISRMADARLPISIVPFRGEYYELAPAKHHLVKGLIYPVPDPKFPFLGVHFTRRIGGGVEAGPNAVLAWKREGYSKTSFNLRDSFEFATFPGFWRMAAKNWRASVGEYYRSWRKAAFVHALQKLIPELAAEDLIPGGSGVRAQAVDKSGKLVDDFHIAYTQGMIHVCNVPSPAATASLAIAEHIVSQYVSQAATLN